jgi:hypothetical protein
MEEKIALFLYRFSRLKHATNNRPGNLTWLGKERPDLQELCFEVEQAHQSIAHLLATKPTKHSFVTVPFENEWKEYERGYREIVSNTAKPARARALQALLVLAKKIELFPELQERIKDSGKSEEEYWEEYWEEYLAALRSGFFNPVADDPAALMRGSRNLVDEILSADNAVRDVLEMVQLCDDDYYQKVLGAWEFFEGTLGLDLSAIYKRWRSVPEVFIQPHVAQLENAPVVELYAEAVRSYVFGSRIASMTMCRALMEHVLKRHYKIETDDLRNIIAMAEARHPQLKKLKMQEKRRVSNEMLHNYEGGNDVEDQVLVDYFRILKYLIQAIPKR